METDSFHFLSSTILEINNFQLWVLSLKVFSGNVEKSHSNVVKMIYVRTWTNIAAKSWYLLCQELREVITSPKGFSSADRKKYRNKTHTRNGTPVNLVHWFVNKSFKYWLELCV